MVVEKATSTIERRESVHRPGEFQGRLRCDEFRCAPGEAQLDTVHLEQLLILFDQGVARLGQDVEDRLFRKLCSGARTGRRPMNPESAHSGASSG